MSEARRILTQAPVIPVLAIAELEHAVPLARALVAGGLPVLEVTLRTAAALDAIRAIAEAVPEAIVGAGTVLNSQQFRAACNVGSRFVVSPGLTTALLETAAASDVPLIPGVATVSEIMLALEHDVDCLKFFPAEASGGAPALRAFAGPLPQVSFCPTGGVGLHNIADYLALPSVLTVGGSWLTPAQMMEAGDWEGIQRLAAQATETVRDIRGHS
jgi:2-dehydro-3-deoxyphosphogluconate aldolase/(4S)-4-hydroxy-2-oxoglutarate aldolase